MQAILNDYIVAEADKDDLIYIEGNWYFPPSSLNQEHFQESGIKRVGKDFGGYMAFDKTQVVVTE
jgi:uncharacterized protein (DUF427 family)